MLEYMEVRDKPFFFPEKSKLEIGTFNILVILFITLFINDLYTLLR